MNNYGYLKSMEPLTLKEFTLEKLRAGCPEIISQINSLLTSVGNKNTQLTNKTPRKIPFLCWLIFK